MENKLSYYSIFSEPVDNDGKRILFSARTAKLLLVPSLTYKYLTEGKINDIPSVVTDKLSKIKAVVPSEENELDAIISENRSWIGKYNTDTLYEVIQPSANCQLSCIYCGQEHKKINITGELMDSMINRINNKLDTAEFKNLYIAWYGGEPLLAKEEMSYLTHHLKKKCSGKGISYSSKMVSNGYNLDRRTFIELGKGLSVRNLEITLDGTGEYHNGRRYSRNGKGTFDTIFNNLKDVLLDEECKSLNIKISLRCNVDMHNYESVPDLLDLLYSEKLSNKIAFYTAPVHNWGNSAGDRALDEIRYGKLELGWLKKMIKLGFKTKLLPRRVFNTCVALSDISDVYDAYGNIFGCTEFPYVSDYYSSGFISGKLTGTTALTGLNKPFINWFDNLVAGDYPCKKCNLLPVCGGACPKSWNESVQCCPGFKSNIKERLKIMYKILSASSVKEFGNETDL